MFYVQKQNKQANRKNPQMTGVRKKKGQTTGAQRLCERG